MFINFRYLNIQIAIKNNTQIFRFCLKPPITFSLVLEAGLTTYVF
jgi:hypothetical protein